MTVVARTDGARRSDLAFANEARARPRTRRLGRRDRRQRIDDLTALAVPEQPALSPDGGKVAYVLRTIDSDADEDRRAPVWRRRSTDGRAAASSRAGPADSSPAWSPDGSRIAFLRAQDGPAQIWPLPAGRRRARAADDAAARRGRAGLEPRRLAASRSPRPPTAAATARTRGPDAACGGPIVTDRLDYQADGAGFLRTIRKHLSRPRPGDEGVPAGHPRRLARAATRHGRPTAGSSRSRRRRLPTPTCASAPPSTPSTWARPTRRARARRPRRRARRHRHVERGRLGADRGRAGPATPVGHAGLLRVPARRRRAVRTSRRRSTAT